MKGSPPYDALDVFGSVIASGDRDEDDNLPQGFINILVFDRFYNLVDAAFSQVGTTAALSSTVTIRQPGFVYVFLSNDGASQQEIGFDNYILTHEHSDVIQQDDYYPFGLSFNSYQRENSTPNPYKFNGKEEQNELDVGWLDYGARMYMSDIGRWGVTDPLADKMRRWNPYNYAYDNPVRFIDPDGMKPTPKQAARMAAHVYGGEPDKILKGGWHVSSRSVDGVKLTDDKTGLKSAVYERKGKDGKIEYAYVTAGTDGPSKSDLENNGKQLTGTAEQYKQSTDNAAFISQDMESELTYVGHSLGGGLQVQML